MNRSAASECDHPTYPEFRERFGEDPARVLYHLSPAPRIEALESVALCRAYLDVETGRDEPRRRVVAAINQRLAALQDADADGEVEPEVATA